MTGPARHREAVASTDRYRPRRCPTLTAKLLGGRPNQRRSGVHFYYDTLNRLRSSRSGPQDIRRRPYDHPLASHGQRSYGPSMIPSRTKVSRTPAFQCIEHFPMSCSRRELSD